MNIWEELPGRNNSQSRGLQGGRASCVYLGEGENSHRVKGTGLTLLFDEF